MSLSILQAAREFPDRPALVSRDGTLTFRQLASRAANILAWLEERGLASGAEPAPRVALVAENRTASLVAFYALAEAGVPAVMVHPRLTPRERSALVQATRPALVLDGAWQEPPGGARAEEIERREPLPDDGHPFAVLFTSGTEGAPKGAVLSRAAFAASARAHEGNLGWRDGDRWLLDLPFAHVGGLSIITRSLAARRTVVLGAGRFDPAETVRAVDRERVTLLSVVPTMLRRLLDHEPAWTPPAPVRAILVGGAAAPRGLLGEAAERGWPVLTTYGCTEACSQVTAQRPGTVNRGELGAGRPLPGIEVRIRTEGSAGAGEAGDGEGVIEVRSPTVFSGYLPADRFPHPVSDDGWLDTGDHGRLDAQGHLHVLGRRADRIVTGGENVDPAEIEQALEEHPGIEAACVFGVEDPAWGEVVAAALVAGRGEPPSGEDLLLFCRERLARHKLPRAAAWLDSLPTARAGKPDRQATAALATPQLRPL